MSHYDTADLAHIGEPTPCEHEAEDGCECAITPMTGRLPEPEAGTVDAAKLALRRASEQVDWFGQG